MIHRSVLVAAGIFLSTAALAAPQGKKAQPKLVEVRTCPVTGEAVKGAGGGNEVVGKYRVYFCCAGCKPDFDKLSAAQKAKKVATLAPKPAGKKG